MSFTLNMEEGFADLEPAGRDEKEGEEAALVVSPPPTSLSAPLPR